MKKINYFPLVVILFLMACSSDEEVAPSPLLSPSEGDYVLLFIFEEGTSQDTINEVSGRVIDKAIEENLFYEATISQNPEEYNLELEQLPAIVVIGSEQIELKTYQPEEAIEFFEEQG